MKRLDRARHVRDAILNVPRDQWEWVNIGGHRYLTLKTANWRASLATPFGGQLSTLPEATTYQQALILQAARAPLPNLLDVWLVSGGKVLSVEWDGDLLRLISMRRGPWEADLFGLPDYQERAPRTGGRSR